MKQLNEDTVKKELIKIIKNSTLETIDVEPRYLDWYNDKKVFIGNIITIRTKK
jgi:hypothetical protein